jgi:hypothetical protein
METAADADRAPAQYRPLQQPRSYPPLPQSAPQAPQSGGAPVPPAQRPATPVAEAPTPAGAQNLDQAQSGFRTRIAQARETFWHRDMPGALQAYRSLVEAFPEQPDGWGELGNLYLTLGQRSVAADAYYHAVSLLIDEGETVRARHLLRMLYGLDSVKASELEKRLRQVGS